MLSLNHLPIGQTAKITAVHAEQSLRQRLHALGFRAGKSLFIMRKAAFDGPIQVRLNSTDVIIRQQDACCIEVTAVS